MSQTKKTPWPTGTVLYTDLGDKVELLSDTIDREGFAAVKWLEYHALSEQEAQFLVALGFKAGDEGAWPVGALSVERPA